MKKKAIVALSALAALTACGTKKQAEEPATRSLIVYYSQTGTTEQVAQIFQQLTGADTMRIEAEQPYEGDFNATIARCQEEMQNQSLPTLLPLTKNVEDYDTLYIGYPVWFGIPALPMQSFLSQVELKGKVVIPFCTFGSGGNTSIEVVTSGGAIVPAWYGVRAARVGKAEAEVKAFLTNLGILEGEEAELPDFSEQVPVSDSVRVIYDAACGTYPMPLGTPVSVGQRATAEGTEYLFTNESQSEDGQVATSTIYVIAYANGDAPEFTQVVR